MENLWFVALVAVVGVIRWALQAAETRKNEQAARRNEPAPTNPLQRAPAETEEERMRRFFEALGVPKGASPPRRVVPRAPKKIMPVDAFPLPRAASAPPARAVVQEPVVVIPPVAPAPAPSPTLQPSIVEVKAVTPIAESPDDRTMDFAERIANAGGFRDAIILREILGPPRSMQPLT